MRYLVCVVAVAAFPAMGSAATVDLSSWIENGFQGSNGAGTWSVQGTGNDSVFQSINGNPTVFFEAGTNSQGNALGGRITVETSGDDDFIGFVLGYQNGEMNSTNADFWLLDWKQNDQSPAIDGLALSHVTGDITGAPANDFWEHVGVVNEVQRGTNLGSTGWVDNRAYDFELVFTDSLIEISVDGVKEISYDGTFTDGAFGFYNYSQGSVRYAGITETIVPPTDPNVVPLPAGMPLLLAGLGAFAYMRRKASKTA